MIFIPGGWTQRHFLPVLLLPFLWIKCTGQHNVVRLSHNKKLNISVYSLSTEHYLRADGDRVAELDKGQRTVVFTFLKEMKETFPVVDKITVTVKLYANDPVYSGVLHIFLDGVDFPFIADRITKENFTESVTVLDTGQRQESNTGLSNSAQAQTGYTTFGKPVAAGSAKRNWQLYRFSLKTDARFANTVLSAKDIAITTDYGKDRVEIAIAKTQLRAWKKYFANIFDEEMEP